MTFLILIDLKLFDICLLRLIYTTNINQTFVYNYYLSFYWN